MLKKIMYVAMGFLTGVLSVWAAGELRAQFDDESGGYRESVVRPALPAKYGKLVAVSGIDMYFSDQNGNVYLVRPKNNGQMDTSVTVIRRQ
ncbi:MAG: hypothetical protein WC732_01975 [Candidatus Omnitrophota bacterium]